MNNSEQQIEQEIQAKGLNAPRLTPDLINSKIKDTTYILPRDVCKRDNGVEVFDAITSLQTLTFCVLTLENGFTVTGESACASPENFDAEIGKKIAFENAREKIWLLEGYLLKQKLHEQAQLATPYQRVLVEQSELLIKLNALNDLLSKPKPDFISQAQWDFMHDQQMHMRAYNSILLARLIEFKKD